MTCDDIRVALSLLADHEPLDDVTADAVAAHVVTCDGCAAFAHRIGQVRASLRLEPVVRTPDIAAGVVARLRAATPPGSPLARPASPNPSADGPSTDDRHRPALVAGAAQPGASDHGTRPAPHAAPVPGPAGTPAATGPAGPACGALPVIAPEAPGARGDDVANGNGVADPTGDGRRPGGDGPGRLRGVARRGPGRAGPGARSNARPRRSTAVAALAAALAGFVAGATFVGVGTEPPDPAAAGVPERVLAAQHDVTTLRARYDLVERGRPDGQDDRHLDVDLSYEAPEALALTITEGAGGAAPRAGDVRLVARDGDWVLDATRLCAAGDAGCPSEVSSRRRQVRGREPFSDGAVVPLDLVNPVDGFTLAGDPPSLGRRDVAGREATGVLVTAAQVSALVDGLSPADDLRRVHPTDPVELWLDEERSVPLALVVRAGDGDDRARWAAAHGYADAPGAAVVELTARSVTYDDPLPAGAFAAVTEPSPGDPADELVDEGFRDGEPVDVPSPHGLPGGFRPHRAGTTTVPGRPAVGVRSWTDGRAWLKVRATTGWAGPRLFGDLGADVRVVDLGDAGVGYAADGGRRVALHADGIDLVLSGSVAPAELREVAARLGVVGEPVPAGWDAAATATLADARAAVPGLLAADGLAGFGAPAVRLAGGGVVLAYAGPGDRGFTLARSAAAVLSPPSGADAVEVHVRGVAGRYSVDRGELEWVEGDAAHALRSTTLSLPELLAIADTLAPA